MVAGLRYACHPRTFAEMKCRALNTPRPEKVGVISHVAAMRGNRRHRPPRAFELVSYVFDMEHNFGMFRDMHRHRMLTMMRQPLSASYGYDAPPELEDAGCMGEFAECMGLSREAYDTMAETDANTAQYVVNFAYRCRYMVRVNLRELCHMVELRTIPQGHRDYRNAARSMYEQVRRVHPDLAQIVRFADMNEYAMGRIGPESRAASKH